MNTRKLLLGLPALAAFMVPCWLVASPLEVKAPGGATQQCKDLVDRLNAAIADAADKADRYMLACRTDKEKSSPKCAQLQQDAFAALAVKCGAAGIADAACGTGITYSKTCNCTH